MSDDKMDATFHPGGEGTPLPQRDPLAGMASFDPGPVEHRPASAERPWVSPGPPPWDSKVHLDLAVQHGWPTPRPAVPSSTVAVWALVTGVVGVVFGWCLFGLPCVAAVVLGHVGLNQTRNDVRTGRGMAVAGLVLGYVALAPAVAVAVWLAAGGWTSPVVTAP